MEPLTLKQLASALAQLCPGWAVVAFEDNTEKQIEFARDYPGALGRPYEVGSRTRTLRIEMVEDPFMVRL